MELGEVRFQKTVLDSLVTALPEEVWTSEAIEERLAPAYARAGLQRGRIELMTGIRERRMWAEGTRPSAASAMAVNRLLDSVGVDREKIDILMHTAVSRDRLEPATAATVHRLAGLGGGCQIFDLSNACLGFLNGLLVAAAFVESGQADRVLVAAGENGRPLVEGTIRALNAKEDLNRQRIKPWFANLTVGCGAVAALVCRENLATTVHPVRLRGGSGETDTRYSELCEGDASGEELVMATDSEELLVAGIGVAGRSWDRFCEEMEVDAGSFERIVTHQVGRAHQRELYRGLGLDPALDYPTFPVLGNVGSVSCPATLAMAMEAGAVVAGNRVALLGIGSGLSSVMLDVEVL